VVVAGILDIVETDLAIRTAFSGGLLADLDGRALGMNNAGVMRGTSLALPAATLRRVVESVLAHGHVRRGFLGIGTIPVRLPAALEVLAGQASGLLVTSVQEDSGAGKAGLLLGDVLVAAAGHPIAGPGDLLPLLEEDRIGQAVALRLIRGGQAQDATVTIGAREGGGRS
jgi:S1-C subfamily serine protease